MKKTLPTKLALGRPANVKPTQSKAGKPAKDAKKTFAAKWEQ